MYTLAVIYHSAHGHTAHIAARVAEGANSVAGVSASLLTAESLTGNPDSLLAYDAYIFGTPTYFGGPSGVFKTFMDGTGRLWRNQQLRGRLAAGFTVSSLPAGDKHTTLLALFTFSMQHGLVWVGHPVLPEQHAGVPYDEAANRLGSWTGLMAQSDHAAPPDAFAPGDLKSARLFGRNVAATLQRLAAPAGDAP